MGNRLGKRLYWVYGAYIIFIVIAYVFFAIDILISKGIGNVTGTVIFVILYFLSSAWVLLMKKRSLWFLLIGPVIFPPILPILVIALRNKA